VKAKRKFAGTQSLRKAQTIKMVICDKVFRRDAEKNPRDAGAPCKCRENANGKFNAAEFN